MNYEQKYKEALEKRRKIHRFSNNPTVIKNMENIFPELKESEDERIRKEIIQSIQDNMCVIHKDKCIAWLEKQGEQKPKFRVGDTIKCKYDDRQFTIKSVDLDKGTYTYTQEGCGNDIDYADEEFELVEQKPTDKVEPKFKVGPQEYPLTPSECFKPVWSEEDEAILSWCIDDIERAKYCKSQTKPGLCDKEINWLKSLKDRVQPQSKQGWSEEDDYVIEKLLCLLDNEQNNYPQLSCDFQEFQEIKDWLKSLKPQKHWKPSEEQLNEVKEAIGITGTNGIILLSLYNDLKNL